MIVGIVIFVGGIIATMIITHFFTPVSQAKSANVTLHPVTHEPLYQIATAIEEEIENRKPAGEMFNMQINVTDQLTELYPPSNYRLPWSSFDLTNTGPNPVYLSVNQGQLPEAPLPIGQSINIDFKQPNSVKRVFLKCDPGLSTTVDLYIVK